MFATTDRAFARGLRWGLCTVTLLACSLASCQHRSSQGQAPRDEVAASVHITALKEGNFDTTLPTRPSDPATSADYLYIWKNAGTPYHLSKLIEIGPSAGAALLDLLADDTSTPFEYRGVLSFQGGLSHDLTKRTATLGDMADYALRCIYSDDVGYRSYLLQAEREATIEQWRKIVADSEKVR
ncbi:hypothetical protein LCGC14_0017460 [marine sediment metagenome]|uniref:Lipoprotein n=1 Tax=marine sediment metagenome TaxID=412755 RepID=A0A0F9WFQ5_9ZZZZ|nr:hypothetical protein [Phycisphaerae bacterium]HDZ42450.1 hypothetical protein [Phycisphaerae bacterium]